MRWIALLVLLGTVAVAGCGGGSKATTSSVGQRSAGTTSKVQYIEVADAICGNHQSRRDDLESQARELGPLRSPAQAHQVAALLRKERANLLAELSELQARRPESADSALESFFAATHARADVLERWASAYDALDKTGIRRLQIRLGLIAAVNEQTARKYGFEVCGR